MILWIVHMLKGKSRIMHLLMCSKSSLYAESLFSVSSWAVFLFLCEQAELVGCDDLVRVPRTIYLYPCLPELGEAVEAFFADVFRREIPELLSPGAGYDYSGLGGFEHFAADGVGFADFESVSADSAGLRFLALKN